MSRERRVRRWRDTRGMCEDITSSRAKVDGFGGGDGMARGPEEREAVGIARWRECSRKRSRWQCWRSAGWSVAGIGFEVEMR